MLIYGKLNSVNNTNKMKNIKQIKKYSLLFFVTIFCLISFHGTDSSNYNKIGRRLSEKLKTNSFEDKILVWVYFKDKGENLSIKLTKPEKFLTQRAIDRRRKVRPYNELVDSRDLPLRYSYIDEIHKLGIKIKNKSKWINAVSCYVNKYQISKLIEKEFVGKVDLVAAFKKSKDNLEYNNNIPDINTNQNNGNYETHLFNYGDSYLQSSIINVPIAHDSGYMGQGILIASFDAGFDNLSHPCFDSMLVRGIRTYDFVNGDTNVANEPGQMGEGSHGTRTLSLVAGFHPGNLISPAFRSKYILAKTENTDSETPVEEDNWIAAAEWADSLGADIITSSLGYVEMDSGSIRSYDWTWMNGDSCVITIGADLAVSRGIIVVNSAGNRWFHETHNTLVAPSDGDSVIATGSIGFDGLRSAFSSVGLSVDGRIKPDFMAVGDGNLTAKPGPGSIGYTNLGSGTSFSCPMAAGVCAIILSANPNLTPMQVINILKQTSSNSSSPNRLIGWGTVNAWASVQLALNSIYVSGNSKIVKDYSLEQNYPNPFNPVTTISFSIRKSGFVKLMVYDVLGKEITTLLNENKIPGEYKISFDGEALPSGVYFYRIEIHSDNKGASDFVDVKKMLLIK